jgi:hypothetical protein
MDNRRVHISFTVTCDGIGNMPRPVALHRLFSLRKDVNTRCTDPPALEHGRFQELVCIKGADLTCEATVRKTTKGSGRLDMESSFPSVLYGNEFFLMISLPW